jgi:hypothetical protein
MTLLDQAIEKVRSLPQEEQDRFAVWMLEELEDEDQWMIQFAQSQDILGELADAALNEFLAGNTTPIDPDKL